MEMAYDGAEVDSAHAHHFLPAVHQPLYASSLPVYAHLLTVCQGSHHQAWAHQRPRIGHLAHPPL
jgi:hypothetical protein